MKSATHPMLDDIVQQNVQTVNAIELATQANRTASERLADRVASFCGSMYFVWVHVVWYGVWLSVNTLTPKRFHFDPPPFGNLTLIVSLEAIFLSTFILISQNRQQKLADQRNHLDLQINLLAEQESSHVIQMLRAILEHHDIEVPDRAVEEALGSNTDAAKLAESVKNTVENGQTPP